MDDPFLQHRSLATVYPDPPRPTPRVPARQSTCPCRICGTRDPAIFVHPDGTPGFWREPGLCSGCDAKLKAV